MVAAGLALPALLAARAALGAGEGVALPAMNSLIADHVPPGARATALGASFCGFHAGEWGWVGVGWWLEWGLRCQPARGPTGGAATRGPHHSMPPRLSLSPAGNLLGLAISPLLLAAFGWRGMFVAFGLAGIPLLAAWLRCVPPRPAAPPPSPSAPSPSHPSPATLLSSPAVWGIVVANIVNHWGYFIYLGWMPTYFVQSGLSLGQSSALSFVPWLAMAAGSAVAGVVADWAVAGGVAVVDVRRRVQARGGSREAWGALVWVGG